MNVLLPWGHDDIFYDNNVYWFNLTFHSMCIDISGVPDVVVWQVQLYHEHQVEERRGVNYVQAAVLKIINYYNHDELSFSFYHRHYLRIIFRMEFSKWPQGRKISNLKIAWGQWRSARESESTAISEFATVVQSWWSKNRSSLKVTAKKRSKQWQNLYKSKKRISPKNEKIKEKNHLKVNFLQVDQVALVENGFWKPPAIGSLDIYYMRCLFCPQPAVGYLLDETISHEMLIRYHIVIIINQWCRVFAVILTCPAIAGQPGISIRWYVKLWRVI